MGMLQDQYQRGRQEVLISAATRMKALGFTYADTAHVLGLSRARICQLMEAAKEQQAKLEVKPNGRRVVGKRR